MQNKNITIGKVVDNNALAWNVVDDCYLFIKDLTNGSYTSIFQHPVLAFYKRLWDEFKIPTLMAMFYAEGYNVDTKTDTWNISQGTAAFKAEFEANASWLKVQFHSWAAPVRYRTGYSGVQNGIDYSRNAFDDWVTLRAECARMFGTANWYGTFWVPHFYDVRQTEAKQLYDNQGLRGLICPTLNNLGRKEANYLTIPEFNLLSRYGVIQDREVGIIHVLRDFATERIDGTLKTFNTPKHVINYLDNFNHLAMRFQNPETHEIQIVMDTPTSWATYSTKHALLDWASWCKERGIKGRFPATADFDLIQY